MSKHNKGMMQEIEDGATINSLDSTFDEIVNSPDYEVSESAAQQAVNEIIADEESPFDAVTVTDLRPDSTKTRDEDFPQIWRKTKSGAMTIRQNPRMGKRQRGEQPIIESYDYQDSAKNRYRDAEQHGHDCRFGVKIGEHEIIFSKMFSDWMLENGEIAALYRAGWFIRTT